VAEQTVSDVVSIYVDAVCMCISACVFSKHIWGVLQ